jgi:hypothetical protein
VEHSSSSSAFWICGIRWMRIAEGRWESNLWANYQFTSYFHPGEAGIAPVAVRDGFTLNVFSSELSYSRYINTAGTIVNPVSSV